MAISRFLRVFRTPTTQSLCVRLVNIWPNLQLNFPPDGWISSEASGWPMAGHKLTCSESSKEVYKDNKRLDVEPSR